MKEEVLQKLRALSSITNYYRNLQYADKDKDQSGFRLNEAGIYRTRDKSTDVLIAFIDNERRDESYPAFGIILSSSREAYWADHLHIEYPRYCRNGRFVANPGGLTVPGHDFDLVTLIGTAKSGILF